MHASAGLIAEGVVVMEAVMPLFCCGADSLVVGWGADSNGITLVLTQMI